MSIIDEQYEIPVLNSDLEETIETGINEFKEMSRPLRRCFKEKLNELIEFYNEKRGMKIYNKV